MKAAILSLCILSGVVDSKEDNIVMIEVSSPVEDVEPEYVVVDSRSLRSKIQEGEEINLRILVDHSMLQYCHNPL